LRGEETFWALVYETFPFGEEVFPLHCIRFLFVPLPPISFFSTGKEIIPPPVKRKPFSPTSDLSNNLEKIPFRSTGKGTPLSPLERRTFRLSGKETFPPYWRDDFSALLEKRPFCSSEENEKMEPLHLTGE
jgi:hypothetical protein